MSQKRNASCFVFVARMSSSPLSTPPNWIQVCKIRREQVERRDLQRGLECTRRWCTVLHHEHNQVSNRVSFLTIHCLLGLFYDSRLATPWLLSLAWIHRWSYCPNGCCGSLMARWALGKRVTQHSHRVREIYNINNTQKKQQSKRKEFLNLNQSLWILFITQLLGLLSIVLIKGIHCMMNAPV